MPISQVTNTTEELSRSDNRLKMLPVSNASKEPIYPKNGKRFKSPHKVEPTTEDEAVAKSIAPLILELYPKIIRIMSAAPITPESLTLIREPLQRLKTQMGHLSLESIKMFIRKFSMIPPSVNPNWYKLGMPQDMYKDVDFVPASVKDDLIAGWIAYNIKY
jgi:hypothetical protein